MDVEGTIEFILQQQARVEATLQSVSERLDRLAARDEERSTREAQAEKRVDQIERRGLSTEAILRRAIRLSVQEARAERERRRKANAEWDEKITRLAAAQLITEEKLQSLIDFQRRSSNGHPPA